jgi:CRP-like cAMP-binding protein
MMIERPVRRSSVTLDAQQKMELLRHVALFSEASDDSLRQVAERTGEQAFPAGRHIVSQGQGGNGLYLIVSGSVRVVRGDEGLARLGHGEVFGELTVIDQMPRHASVVTEEPTVCLALAAWDFLEILESDPRLALGVLKVLAARLRASGEQHRHW